MAERARVRLEPWGEGDLPLLRRLMGDPAMTEHLGGPESEEKLTERQGRYQRIGGTGAGRRFKIVDEATGEPAGSGGYRGEDWGGTTTVQNGRGGGSGGPGGRGGGGERTTTREPG